MAGIDAAGSATAGGTSSGSGSGSEPGSTSGTTEPTGFAQSPTTAESLARQPTTADLLMAEPTPPDFEENIYSYKDDNTSVDVGRARWDFKPPTDTGFNSETVSRKFSGGFTADLTGAEMQGKFGPYDGEVSTNGKVTALTANAHATYEAGFHLKGPTKPGANVSASAGAEAMAINGAGWWRTKHHAQVIGRILQQQH